MNMNARDWINSAARTSGWEHIATDDSDDVFDDVTYRCTPTEMGRPVHQITVRYRMFGTIRGVMIYGPTGINWGVVTAWCYEGGDLVRVIDGPGKKREVVRYIRDRRLPGTSSRGIRR